MGLRVDIRIALAIASLTILGDALLAVGAVFHVRIAAQYEALIAAVSQLLETITLAALVAGGAGLEALIAVSVAARFASVAASWLIARRRFGVVLAVDLARMPGMLRAAAPVGVSLAIAVAYLKLDGVLLGLLATSEDVGLYGVAGKLIEYPMLGLMVALSPVFPLLARWWIGDRPRFAAAHGAGIDGLVAVTLPLVVVSALVSPSLIRLVFSDAFLPSASALTVLSVALVFIMHNAWQGFGLLAAGFQRTILLYDAAGLAVNLGLNLWLITSFGYMGAAWAALATSVFIAVCSLLASSAHLRVRQSSGRVLGVVAANGVLYGVLWALLQINVSWASATLVAIASYPGWLLLFRVVTLEELRRLAPRESGALAGASGTAGV